MGSEIQRVASSGSHVMYDVKLRGVKRASSWQESCCNKNFLWNRCSFYIYLCFQQKGRMYDELLVQCSNLVDKGRKEGIMQSSGLVCAYKIFRRKNG